VARSRFWTSAFCASPAHLPFSFVYDGKKTIGIPDWWDPKVARRRIDTNIV